MRRLDRDDVDLLQHPGPRLTAAVINTIAVGLSRQARVVTALMIREVRLRNSKHAFMQLFDVMEAIGYIIGLWLIMSFTGRKLLIGDNLLLFIATGVFPVLFFRTMSIRAAGAIEASKFVTSVPYIEALDYSFARTAVEFFTFSLLFSIFFVLLSTVTHSRYSMPTDAAAIAEFAIGIFLFSLGVGLVNSFVIYIFPLWKFVWSMFSRVQIFFNAVLFIPEYMPPPIKNIIVYNPVVHFVTLFRSAFYPSYPMHIFSREYMWGWTFAVLLIGLALERALRNHRGT